MGQKRVQKGGSRQEFFRKRTLPTTRSSTLPKLPNLAPTHLLWGRPLHLPQGKDRGALWASVFCFPAFKCPVLLVDIMLVSCHSTILSHFQPDTTGVCVNISEFFKNSSCFPPGPQLSKFTRMTMLFLFSTPILQYKMFLIFTVE